MENVQSSEHSRYTDREVHFSSLLVNEIENENFDEVKRLLLHKYADPNLLLPHQGVSAMHILAGIENECFSVEVMEIALEERGGDPNIRSVDGLTPVHLAAIWGRCAVLETLLKYGGDPFLLDYKFSLNAEDLALKEHQWQTHAILATFSVFNDKLELDCYYLHSSSCKPSSTKTELPYDLREMKPTLKNAAYKEYQTDCADSLVSKIKNSQDSNSNMSLGEAECERKGGPTYQAIQSKSANSNEKSLNFCGNKPCFDGEGTNEQSRSSKKKKLSDQFAESFVKFKHFFGRASFPKSTSANSPKVDFNRKASKTSI